jgi:hypothetical protein
VAWPISLVLTEYRLYAPIYPTSAKWQTGKNWRLNFINLGTRKTWLHAWFGF